MDTWLCWVILLRAESPWRNLCWDWSLGRGTSCPGVPGCQPAGWPDRSVVWGSMSEPSVEWGPWNSAPWGKAPPQSGGTGQVGMGPLGGCGGLR